MRKLNLHVLLSSLLFAVPSAAQSTGATGGGTSPPLVEQPLPFTARGPLSPVPAGSKPPPDEQFKFDYHGYIRAGMRVGVGKRQNPTAGQSSTTLHEPLLIDDQYLNWNYTRSQEKNWAEMFFSYGNAHVVGTVGVVGYNFDDWEHYPDAQWGIGQGWVTIRPDPGLENASFEWKVGSFWEKFGQAGKYDAGPYDTYLFGRTHQMGESLSGQITLDDGDLTLKAEHGFGAHGEGVAYQFTAYSFVHHAHAGLSYKNIVDVNLHWLDAFEQDGRPDMPDGSFTVIGPEARISGGLFGDLYVGYSMINAKNAIEVGPVLEVVHSQGGGGGFGIDLTSNFFNTTPNTTYPLPSGVSNGTGKVNTLEFNYEYSFGLLWRELQHPGIGFGGDGTDVKLGIFGMYTTVDGVETVSPTAAPLPTSGIKKLKVGGDLGINILPWFSVGARFDRVAPNVNDSRTSFSVFSPRLVFRTGWNSHEQISLVWSHYTYGELIDQGFGKPPLFASPGFNGPVASYGGGGGVAPYWTTSTQAKISPPDKNAVTLKATMWW